MAMDLNSIAKGFTKKIKEKSLSVPEEKDVDLAINVASCDGLPCLVIFGKNKKEVQAAKSLLQQVCWKKEIVGKYVFVTSTSKKEIRSELGVDKKNPSSGFFVVKPNRYGTSGKVLASLSLESSAEELEKLLIGQADEYDRISKTHGSHVRTGRRQGINWETEVEVPKRRRGRSR